MRRDSPDDPLLPLVATPHRVHAAGPPRLLVMLLIAVVLCLGGVLRLWAAVPPWRADPRQSAVVSGVTLRLDETHTSRVRLRFEVCGADGTQLPETGFPVRLAFDTSVGHVGVHAGRTRLGLEAHVTGPAATVSLWREPFTPPESWRIVILIDVERLPTAGGLTLGAWPAHDLAPELAAASEQAQVVVGVGCDELHAKQDASEAVPRRAALGRSRPGNGRTLPDRPRRPTAPLDGAAARSDPAETA